MKCCEDNLMDYVPEKKIRREEEVLPLLISMEIPEKKFKSTLKKLLGCSKVWISEEERIEWSPIDRIERPANLKCSSCRRSAGYYICLQTTKDNGNIIVNDGFLTAI